MLGGKTDRTRILRLEDRVAEPVDIQKIIEAWRRNRRGPQRAGCKTAHAEAPPCAALRCANRLKTAPNLSSADRPVHSLRRY